jgi:hypothetical protein
LGLRTKGFFGHAGRNMMGVVLLTAISTSCWAQTCTTQAKMTTELRSEIADSALYLAAAVQAGDAARVQGAAVAEFASNFVATTGLIKTTAAQITGDTLHVTQVYALDAKARKAGDTSAAEFSCTLTGTGSETDFSIGGLPPGMYGFAMVEASGERPWLLSMLMRQEGLSWKLAGIYPRVRTAAGRDGLTYWKGAREQVAAKKLWLGWLSYTEADELLRPANFVSTTNLSKLRTEQHDAAPAELANGVSKDAPVSVTGPTETFRITGLSSLSSDDGKHLNLVVHVDGAGGTVRSQAVAKALLDAHRDLRDGYEGVLVVAESGSSAPAITMVKVSDIQ